MLRGLAFALLGLASCFTPEVEQGLPCSASNDCPGDQSCENGVCWGKPTRAVAIAAGSSHTCAVLDNGAVRCWGRSGHGQLGYADLETIGDDETPASRGSVNVGGTVIAVALGTGHTCALIAGGTVRCWGEATLGRLGYGNSEQIGDDEAPATAGDVEVGGPVAQITASDSHTCALLEAGTVRCWGLGTDGRLGYGNTDWIGDNELPKYVGDVAVGGTVVAVDAGTPNTGRHTCVLLDTGTVRCWGYGQNGRLGYGNTDSIGDDEVPSSAGDVDVGGRVIQVVAGGAHTCALLEGGTVRCWGEGAWGKLGYGNVDDIGDDEVPSSAGDVDVGGTVVQLAAGVTHTCALLDTGGVRCWGQGRDGQLGHGDGFSIGDDEVPAAAGDVDLGGRAIQIAAGTRHTCALLETGAVRCWGAGADGRLGYGNVDNIGDDETPASAGDVPLF